MIAHIYRVSNEPPREPCLSSFLFLNHLAVSQFVKPKKYLGQHFLRDEQIAQRVADSLTGHGGYRHILEVGPGTGALTRWLLQKPGLQYTGIEVDNESISYLNEHFGAGQLQIIRKDFLSFNPNDTFGSDPFAIVGNFPYNISSQILFKAIEWRQQVPELVGMFQKEVAERIASKPGNKVYGILSVITQAFYDVELLFHVSELVFDPPPKVKSAVIRLKRKEDFSLGCDERLFFTVVKVAFNQRRKTLRNALKSFGLDWAQLPADYPGQRAERLDVDDFVAITRIIKPV